MKGLPWVTSLILAPLGACLLAGCASNHVTVHEDRPAVVVDLDESGIEIRGGFNENGTVTIEDPAELYEETNGTFRLADLRGRTEGNGIHRLQASIENQTSDKIRMRWRVVWLDSDGFEMSSGTQGWFPATMAAREVKVLSSASPSPDAGFFRIFVREVED